MGKSTDIEISNGKLENLSHYASKTLYSIGANMLKILFVKYPFISGLLLIVPQIPGIQAAMGDTLPITQIATSNTFHYFAAFILAIITLKTLNYAITGNSIYTKRLPLDSILSGTVAVEYESKGYLDYLLEAITVIAMNAYIENSNTIRLPSATLISNNFMNCYGTLLSVALVILLTSVIFNILSTNFIYTPPEIPEEIGHSMPHEPAKTKIDPTSKEETKIKAFHEAGHAIIASLVGAKVSSVSINPVSNSGGRVASKLNTAEKWQNNKDVEKIVMICYAGIVAERIYLGDESHKSSSAEMDIEQATSLIVNYITKHGGAGPLLSFAPFGRNLSADKFIWNKCAYLANKLEKECTILLQSYKECLDAAADLIIEKKSLTGEEWERVFNDYKKKGEDKCHEKES